MAFPQLTASITHHHQHHPELNQASHMKHHDAFFLVFEINFICKNVLTKFEILHSNPYNIGKICFFSNFFLSCFFILKFKLMMELEVHINVNIPCKMILCKYTRCLAV